MALNMGAMYPREVLERIMAPATCWKAGVLVNGWCKVALPQRTLVTPSSHIL